MLHMTDTWTSTSDGAAGHASQYESEPYDDWPDPADLIGVSYPVQDGGPFSQTPGPWEQPIRQTKLVYEDGVRIGAVVPAMRYTEWEARYFPDLRRTITFGPFDSEDEAGRAIIAAHRAGR